MELQKKMLPPLEADSYLPAFAPVFDETSRLISQRGHDLGEFLPLVTFELTARFLFNREFGTTPSLPLSSILHVES